MKEQVPFAASDAMQLLVTAKSDEGGVTPAIVSGVVPTLVIVKTTPAVVFPTTTPDQVVPVGDTLIWALLTPLPDKATVEVFPVPYGIARVPLREPLVAGVKRVVKVQEAPAAKLFVQPLVVIVNSLPAAVGVPKDSDAVPVLVSVTVPSLPLPKLVSGKA